MSELKVTADHLKRDAYLYVRQSMLRQVARAAKVRSANMLCITGRSPRAGRPSACASSIAISTNPARLLPPAMASRSSSAKWRSPRPASSWIWKSRASPANSADWHRLIELRALTATLILDEDGIYDASNFNDRLLLGLKGTMSEAELHILKARVASLRKLDAANSRSAPQRDWSTDPTA